MREMRNTQLLKVQIKKTKILKCIDADKRMDLNKNRAWI
jgi:hypothetical protein